MGAPPWLASPFLLLPVLLCLFLLPSCTPSCTLSSTTWSSWKACATPPTRRVRTPTTSPPPSRVMSPTSWPSASSTTHRVPFSYVIPSSDQDVDDLTLGKMLTEAYRGQADYCEPEGMSVSQSSTSVVFDGSGKPDGERNVDQSVGFGITRNTYSAHSKFLETPKLRKWSIEQGNLRSEIAQMHRLGLFLKSKDRWLSRNIAKKSVITNSKQLM